MKRPLAIAGTLAVTAGLMVGTMVAPFVGASDHREAPYIVTDPYADLTDLYAFVSPDEPDTVTMILNQIPYQEPMAGPNFYGFDDKVLYEIHVSNDGGANADITYRVRFRTEVKDPTTFLYNTGPFLTPRDPNLNVEQFATITRVTPSGETMIGEELAVQPVHIGPRSNPGREDTLSGMPWIHEMDMGEGMFFAGQRGDPFFLDLAVFDLLALRPLNQAHVIPLPTQPGSNTFLGYNTHSIALQVPITRLTHDGQAPASDGSNAIIGVWGTSSRQQTRVLSESGFGDEASGEWIQVERLGHALVNEVIVPRGFKDHFNRVPPTSDATFLPTVQDPQLPHLMNALYGVDVPDAPRNDLVSVFLTGVQGLNQPANVTASEMLRLNMGIAPTAEVGMGNRMGVLAGDNAGYPNGRRLEDDVVDISLRVAAGVLVPGFDMAPNNVLTDGVNESAQDFNWSFPYVSAPYQGYDHAHHTP